MEQVFLLKGLDCPNCAAKIEKEIGALDGVEESHINLMQQTLTLRIDSKIADTIEKQVEIIVHSREPEVKVSRFRAKNAVEDTDDQRKMLLRLLVGAILFIIGIFLGKFSLPVLVLAYLLLGGDVLLKAARNIAKGRIFDENFLMSISTIGAFVIGEYPEAVAVMLFYQVGEFFQAAAVKRSRKSIEALMDIRPDSATVIRDGQARTVSPDTVAVGEIILVKPGEKIPLDGVVLEGESMLDTVALTGESVPKTVGQGDPVLSGCVNQSGVLTVEVAKPFGESTVSKIINLVENASGRKAPTENFITTFARYYTPVVVILAVLLGVVPPLLLQGGWAVWLHRALVFLVVSCPCALVVSIPLAFFGGIGAASKHGVLVKGSNYLEALHRVETIVFDKTGTLTKGVFNVTHILPAPGFTEAQVLEYAGQAEQYSNHPIAASILAACHGATEDAEDYQEFSGQGVRAVVGAKIVLAGNDKLMMAQGIDYAPCSLMGTKVYVAVDGQFAGCIVIADALKEDSKEALRALGKLGVKKTVLLTGDNDEIAKAVSDELGIDAYYAQLLPHEKVEILERLDREKPAGSKIAFVGDGINDAPVLARADVGIAMGGMGSDAAIEAADVVLMTDEPSKLMEAIQIAKGTKRIVLQNIVFALTVKGVLLLLGALGIAGMWEAVFGDVGVALLAVLNSMRLLRK